MRVGIIGSSPKKINRIDDKSKSPTGQLMSICDSLNSAEISCVQYVPVINLKNTKRIYTKYYDSYIVFLPYSVPILNKIHTTSFITGNPMVYILKTFIENMAYLLKIINRRNQDSIDVYLYVHLFVIGQIAAPILKITGRPYIVYSVGESLLWFSLLKKKLYLISVAIFRIILRYPNLILDQIDEEKKYFYNNILKLPKKKVSNFMGFTVDDNIFQRHDKNSSIQKLNFNPKSINIVMVTRIPSPKYIAMFTIYEKDPFKTLEVFRRVSEATQNFHLHVIGTGVGLSEFKNRVAKYGMDEQVTIHGYIVNNSLPEYYSAADLTFFPYHFITAEYGTVFHESILCGTPVACFKRYPWVEEEQLGCFLIDTNPQIGVKQLLPRLNEKYLKKKAEETKKIPRIFTKTEYQKKYEIS